MILISPAIDTVEEINDGHFVFLEVHFIQLTMVLLAWFNGIRSNIKRKTKLSSANKQELISKSLRSLLSSSRSSILKLYVVILIVNVTVIRATLLFAGYNVARP